MKIYYAVVGNGLNLNGNKMTQLLKCVTEIIISMCRAHEI